MTTVGIFDDFIEVQEEDRSYKVKCSTDALPLKDNSVHIIHCEVGFCDEYERVLKDGGFLKWRTP